MWCVCGALLYVKTGMNVVAALQETWVAYLLDIVVPLLYVKMGMNVVAALQET